MATEPSAVKEITTKRAEVPYLARQLSAFRNYQQVNFRIRLDCDGVCKIGETKDLDWFRQRMPYVQYASDFTIS